MLKSIYNIIWKTLYPKRMFILLLICVYLFDIDDFFNIPIDGPEFALISLIFELIMVITAIIAKRNFAKEEKTEIEVLNSKLLQIDKQNETAEYIKTEREIRRLSNLPLKLTTPAFCNFIRSVVPTFLFSKKYICTFPNNSFWFPMKFFVSFPHQPKGLNMKIGFFFFWNAVITVDNFIIDALAI